MLIIFVNNTPIDLSSFSLSLVKKSAISVLDGIPGSYVFNFNVPASIKNNKLFDFPARLVKKDLSAKSWPIRITFSGLPITEGSATVVQANSKTITLSIAFESGLFNELTRSLRLKDIYSESISLGATTNDVITHCNQLVQNSFPQVDYNFPVIANDHFYGVPPKSEEDDPTNNPQFLGYLNNYLPGTGFISNLVLEGEDDNVNSLVPLFYIVGILKQCFSFAGYSLTGKPLSFPELSQLLLYNNYSLDHLEERYSVAVEHDLLGFIDGFQEHTMPFTEIIRETDDTYNPSTYKYEVKAIGYHKSSLSFTVNVEPGMSGTLWLIVKIIQDGTDIVFQDHFMNSDSQDVSIATTLFYDAANIGDEIYCTISVENQNAPLDEPQWPQFTVEDAHFSVINISQSNLNRFSKSITYSNHMPDVSVHEFLNAFYKTFAVFPVFDHNTKSCELHFIQDILAGLPSFSFSDIIPDTLKATELLYSGYTFKFDFGENDDLLSDNFKEIEDLYSSVDTYSKLPFHPPLNSIIYVRNTNKYFIFESEDDPQTGLPILKYNLYGDEFSDFAVDDGEKSVSSALAPLLMIQEQSGSFNLLPSIHNLGSSFAYNGGLQPSPFRMVLWRGLSGYPLATSYSLNLSAIHEWELDLRWNSLNGIYNSFWKSVIDWYKSRIPIEGKVLITEEDLNQIVFSRIFRLLELNLILGEVSIKLSKDNLSSASFKSWTL